MCTAREDAGRKELTALVDEAHERSTAWPMPDEHNLTRIREPNNRHASFSSNQGTFLRKDELDVVVP